MRSCRVRSALSAQRAAACRAGGSGLAFDAAVFVEADLAPAAVPVEVLIAQLAVLAADLVRFAQHAFHVGQWHAGAHLFSDHGLAPGAAGDAVAAPRALFAH